MSFDEILSWVRFGWVNAAHAIDLHRAGIKSHELGWSYEDNGSDSLAVRLMMGRWSVEQVMNEVERRRSLD
jgi:hypothetical protein